MPVSATSSADSSVPVLIGRFRMIRLLGKGSQSEVYLAHDPHLDREVAIKTLQFASSADQAANMTSLLAEARAVSRLQHPNIVALFDAGEQAGQPYLVFEFVDGPTLAQVLKEEGPVSPVRGVELAIQILDALDFAHKHGIVHRDIKPSNILLGANGIARVMDFGVAGRIDNQGAKSGYLMGTPAYMAPEYISNEEFGPKSDLFSFGMMLYELLTGQHAVRGKNIHEVMRRIVSDSIKEPSSHTSKIDEKLDALILKSLRKDPELRFEDAGQMKNALELYLLPDAPIITPSATDIKQSTLEFLLRRMRHKSDFPALSEAIGSINRITASGKESVNQLSNNILKDFALTNKLLKLVNAALYNHLGGGTISTVSRAVVILGFDSVRSISLSLMIFENMQNKGHALQLKEEFVKVLYAGMLAREMAPKALLRDAEEAFLCSMFHHLGQLLALFYFPEESEEINKLIHAKGYSRDKASMQVLGLTYEDLGIGIAKSWGFPDQLVLSMKKLPDEKVKKAHSTADKLRILSGFSNELCEVILCTPETERAKALSQLRERFGDSLPMTEKQLGSLMEKSIKDIAQFASVVNVNLKQSGFAQRASKWVGMGEAPTTAPATPPQLAEIAGVPAAEMSDTQTALAATVLHEIPQMLDFEYKADASQPQRSTEEIQATLTAGLQDICNSLIDDKTTVNDILRMILETMYTGMGFKHAIFCIKDGRRNAMCGKFGFGDGASELIEAFHFSLVEQPDVFHVALKNNADILISNIDDPKIAHRIPAWYRQSISAATFVVFPITIKGKSLGLIYADRDKPGEIVIPEKELSLLKALRNQAVLAIRQSF